MVMVSFVAAVTGLLVAGYTMIFEGAAHVRMSGVGVIGLAGLIVGGLLTAQLNGGRPYGYDLSIGLEQWRDGPHDNERPAADPAMRRPHHEGGPPVV